MVDYVAAWKGKFQGVNLSWLEIEICRLAMQPRSIGEIIQAITDNYQLEKELTKSSAYRLIDSLIDNDYLEATKEGRNRIIRTLSKGAQELGNLGRYFYEIQRKNMAIEFWEDVLVKIVPYIGCILDHRTCFIGPEYSFVPTVLDECSRCSEFQKFDISKQLELQQAKSERFFLRIAGALIRDRDDALTIIETKVDDWPFKQGYTNLIIEVAAVSAFDQYSILEEMTRVLSPEGWLVLIEFTKSTSTLILRMMRELTSISAMFDEEFKWKSDYKLPSIEELENKVRDMKVYDNIIVISDSITTIILAHKSID